MMSRLGLDLLASAKGEPARDAETRGGGGGGGAGGPLKIFSRPFYFWTGDGQYVFLAHRMMSSALRQSHAG
jgi:hypothetical protein